MANTLLLKRRIRTAQNVSKTTKAMQMIAASKLKRAQDATLASRPYVEKLTALSYGLSQRVDVEELHEFMKKKMGGKTLLIVISPDKGLCGGLITNLLKELLAVLRDDYLFLTIGKKVDKYIVRLGKELVATFPFGTSLPSFDIVFPIASIAKDYFLSEKVTTVQILATHFVSIFAQKPRLLTILPLSFQTDEKKESTQQALPTLFEPNAAAILPPLLSHYLEMVLYQQLLESFLSEQAARMLAMQNATNNAKDIIAALTLEYNKARQQRITSEILDISSASVVL